MIQMLARWHRDGPYHRKFKEHQDRIKDYLWLIFMLILFGFIQYGLFRLRFWPYIFIYLMR